MKIFVLFFSLLCSAFLNAQDEELFTNGVFDFEENRPHKIFSMGTFVRENPGVKALITDTLNSNQVIQILEKTDVKTMLGERSSYWYKISYIKNGEKTGYVWGANFCVGYRAKSGMDFLFGLNPSESRVSKEGGEKYYQNIGSIKLMNGNQLVDEKFFETGSGEELRSKLFSIDENKGLKNVDFIVKASVSGEACGINSYDHNLLYANGKLTLLPTLMHVADGDLFYHSEEFIFPTDKGGQPGKILFKMEEMEKDEKEKENFKRSKKVYFWDGKKLKVN